VVSPINPISVDALAGLRGTAAERARATQAPEAEAAGFGTAVAGALDGLNAAHQRSADAARAAATGDLQSVNDYMIAASEAQLATQITTAVRNRAIESFNEIMRMQI
jgi:flagellar hook-basal body complex protein FliE